MIHGALALDVQPRTLTEALRHVHQPLWLEHEGGGWVARESPRATSLFAPACDPARLGGEAFCQAHGVRYPYIVGAMARGIASVELVATIGRAGMLGIFGAAGLCVDAIERAIVELQDRLGDRPFGVNMIYSPQQPQHEAALCELLLRRSVPLVSASAYVELTAPLVRYRFHGLHRAADGRLVTPNRLIAKVSRQELATKFLSPPPEALLRENVAAGYLTAEQAQWAATLPLVEDLTVEADSGGHTDKRPAIAALPQLIALRDRLAREHGYAMLPRIGAAGGLATPWSVAAAFAMGASYVLTGSLNQACVESGTSDQVRAMLAQAEQADCAMAPAADMFEMGARVQVLKRGTLFPHRANKLDELYRRYDSLEAIPAEDRQRLEQRFFRRSIDEIWQETASFFRQRDPAQLARAEAEPKVRMALVFRWYLGLSSGWAQRGEAGRQIDYQIWCGPSMGAFNEWTRGTFLAEAKNRRVVDVALNMMHGAALATRLQVLRMQGADLMQEVPIVPLPAEQLKSYL